MPDTTLAARLTLALALVTLAGCGAPPAEPRAEPASELIVQVVHPQQKSFRRVVEQPGTVHPDEETQLYARVPGYVAKVYSDLGRKVRGPKTDKGKVVEPGEVLAEIAVPEMVEEANQKTALVRQAEADVDQAKKALASAEATIATVEASVVEARADNERWESESRRMTGLVQGGVVDEQSRDETRNRHKAASARVLATEAGVRKAKADRDKAKADVRSAEARVDVAKAEARRVEAMLVYAKIRAPFDGVVTRRKVSTGDFVQPTVGKGDWLFTVSRLDPVRVVIDVPEADASLVEEKSEVTLTLPALRRPAVEAAVTRISWSLTPISRTLRAEIDLPNPEGKLRPGTYAHASIWVNQPAKWALPASALVKQGDVTVCFRVENGKAVRTPVQAGHGDGQFTEVLKLQKSGIIWVEWSGKEEVANKAAGLSDGQAVRVGGPGT